MAYIRKRGNQLSLVHGTRDSRTKKVEQQILFTIYSKAEALEVIGRSGKAASYQFEQMLSGEFPQLKFNWKSIRSAIADNLETLPDLYPYREERLEGRFRKDLCSFTKQLAISDPQDLVSAAQLVEGHRYELEFLVELIQWRLEMSKNGKERNEWSGDNAFYWKMHLRGQTVPPDLEENAVQYYHSRDYKRARAIFSFLIDSFDNYAEGHNYLGLINLDDNRLEDAALNFEKTIEVGRSLFPKKINRSRYWHHLDTRPYMRGLRNLCLTMNRLGRYDEVLALCDRLEKECNDEITAAAYRASAYLNTGLWKLAAASAKYLHKIDPSESFIVSFAFFEMGKLEEARIYFLHAAFNNPRAARMLVGIKGEQIKPKDREDVQDHNTGVEFLQNLHGYFKKQTKASKVFFKELMNHDVVIQLLLKQKKLSKDNDRQKNPKWRDAFDQLHQMKEVDFAKETATRIEIDE